MISVLFDDRQNLLNITRDNEEAVERAVAAVLREESLDGDFEISVSFVTNQEIRELNKEYRNVDSETDVLSFPMNEEFEGLIILGDIVISTQKIIEQAHDLGNSLEREMSYLIVHSMLHLIGYDHMENDEKSVMRAKEKKIMKNLKIFK